jgi:hypothetical protein
MIVSEAEIRHVLELTRPGRLATLPAAGAHPMAPDPALRLARLRGLRDQLRAGTYDLEPDSVADKMIGRAIVDQIAQLVDEADENRG